MNLPNKLTILRIILTPIFMLTLVVEFPHHFFVALVIFSIASITDMIDGKIARKRKLITNFGKFLDPLADKMLTTAAYLGFIALKIGYGIVWIVFIVLLREFLITSLRLVAVDNGEVIAANRWGKAKTISQMVAIVFTLAAEYILSLEPIKTLEAFAVIDPVVTVLINIGLWISAVLTVISGTIYLVQNKKYVDSSK